MEPALAIFGPLLGQCFVAVIAPGVLDRHCFASVYDGQHVRVTHQVAIEGKPAYSGEMTYSFNGIGLDFTYVNSNGGVGHGAATVEDGTLKFSGSLKPSPDLETGPMAGRWLIHSGGYDVETVGQPTLHFVSAGSTPFEPAQCNDQASTKPQ